MPEGHLCVTGTEAWYSLPILSRGQTRKPEADLQLLPVPALAGDETKSVTLACLPSPAPVSSLSP